MTGKTHQIFNDVAIMRTLPNMTVLAPADEEEARQATRAMIAAPGPFYMQVTREPGVALFDSSYRFEIGKGVVLRSGSDVALVSTGVQTTRVAEAAELLAAQGIEAAVLHLPTIKPIDGDAIEAVARATGFVVVIEGSPSSVGSGEPWPNWYPTGVP